MGKRSTTRKETDTVAASDLIDTVVGNKRKRPVSADELDTAAEVLIKAACNLTAFAALMRQLDITVEFDGAAGIVNVQSNLQEWYRKVRGALAAHERFPDEGITNVRTTSAAKVTADLRKSAQAVAKL